MVDVLIIGAGTVGCYLARRLSSFKLDILTIEKELDVGDVTSKANSAIVHSGYDPLPGSLKAKLNVAGNAMYPELSKLLDFEFEQIGSMTIATNDAQLQTLKDLQKRGEQNGVQCILMSAEEAKKAEPSLSDDVVGALLCPSAGIVNPFEMTAHTMECALDNGAKLKLGEAVKNVERVDDYFRVTTDKGVYETKMVINAAGLHSDEIAKLIEPISWSINPRKGQYYVLDHFSPNFVNHVLFPLPSEKGKGVLVSRTTSNNYIVGPSSEFTDEKDDFSTDSLTLADVKAQAALMVPNIPFREQIRVFAGLRATPSTHDFIIEPSKKYKEFINVAGIESPGLVSSPAIAEYVVDNFIVPVLKPEKKENWKAGVRPHLRPSKMSDEEKVEFVKKNPKYGKIICNCEKVTLGEIEDVLNRSLPCNTLTALKKRSRAGFGKCQTGFCQPKTLMILAKHFHIDPTEVLYDKVGSNPLLKESK